jgi:hypothetical protein
MDARKGSGMFQIGTSYIVQEVYYHEGELGTSDLHNCKCVEVQGPLVKFNQFGKDIIINTTSPMFYGARPQD